MSEMGERVAKVLYDQYADHGDDLYHGDAFYAAEWEDGIRAVLRVMRDPTSEMVDAGLKACEYVYHNDEVINEVINIFRAMIDAAGGEVAK